MSLRLSTVHRSTSRARTQARARNRRRRLWALEGLEGRVLLSGNPTVYTVNLTSDTGAFNGTSAATATSGDLLWAITRASANTNPAGSVIEFDPTVFNASNPQTITLSGTLVLSESDGPEVVEGPGGNLVTISGGLTYNPTIGELEGSGISVLQVDSGTTATLSGVTITGGSAANGAGISNSGCLAVTDSTVEYCIAANDGGGINNDGTLTVTDSTIENSNANNGGGIDNSGTLMITSSAIASNDCFYGNGDGGGIYNSGALTVTDSTIASNDVGNKGGGIENTGMLTLTNATLAGNGSGNNGGGIDNVGTLTAVNTTIAYNLSNSSNTDGGGLYDEAVASTTLYDAIVALNKGLGEYRPGDIAGAPVSSASAYNLIGVGGSGGLTDTDGHHDQVNVADPGLAAGLTSTGGPTETIALLADSAAIDAGSSTIPGVTVPTTDQRGFTRPGYSNGVVDIGAVEAPSFGNPTVYTVNLTSDTGAFNGTSAATATSGDLLWAITQANANTSPAGSVIEFDPTVFSSSSPQTITLSSTLDLSETPWPEVIQGPGANAVTISGNNAVQVLQVGGGTTASISGVTISGGNALDEIANQSGGVWNLGRLNITGCTIVDNSGRESGGIGNQGPYGTLTVTDSTIEDNTGEDYGGAVFNTGGAANFTDCIIEGNSAQLGGGIYAGGSNAINGCTIADNSAFDGAGIFVGFGALTLTNSTITGNSGDYGGAVMGVDLSVFSATSMRVTNCTIADNPSGGIYVTGSNVTLTLTLDNSIVADNAGGSGAADVSVAPTDSLVANNDLIGVDGTGTLTNGVDCNQVGTQAVPINPLLGPLQNNGGPTETMALLPGSPAIDAGSDNIPGITVPTTDQRGALRGPAGLNAGSGVDIGAYEASSSYLVTSTAASTDVGTLQTAIGWANVSTNANPANTFSPAPNTIVFAPPDTQSLDQDLAAISALAVSNSPPPPITIDLSSNTTYRNTDTSGNTVPVSLTIPANVNITLTCTQAPGATVYDLVVNGEQVNPNSPPSGLTIEGMVTLEGSSPALVLNSGAVTIAGGVTLVTATNAPTIQVNGGTLVIRNSTVEQESTTSSQPAIQVNGGSADLGTTASPGGNTLDVNGTGPLIEDTTGSPVSAAGDTFESNGTTVPSSFGNVKLSAPASQTANQGVPQPFSLGSLTDSVQDSQSWAVDVNWGDGFAHTDFSAASTGALSAQIHAFALPGTYTVTITAADPVTGGASAWDLVQTFTVTVAPSAFILDPTAGGALSLSGNATLKIPGAIVVDSISSSALSASGNAQIKSSVIDVHGGVKKSGNASLSVTPTTVASVQDPLALLPAPVGGTSQGSVDLSGSSSTTISPGVYSQITLSGNAKLTLSPGIYVIAGGGFTVSGNASVTGTGVLIYNSKSSTGTYGSVTLSGNGAISLTAPTMGTYAGILIFQDRANPKALTFSGNAMEGITGTIYAPAAQLVESGNAQIGSTSNPVSIIVDTLTISGNGVANTVTLSSPSGTVAYTPAQIRTAYGINALGAGLPTPPLDGTGQTIAIVDAYDDPEIDQALDAFDSQFGLTGSGPTLYAQYGPASSFLTVLNQNGQATSLPSTDPNGPGTDNWEVEEALDVEWAHAIAPGAQIILVEANSQSLSDLMSAVGTAAHQPGVSVVSMSWGFPEGQAVFASDEATYDSVFNVPGVTFVASTGDYGAADPEYPAYSPNVLAVGGTSLALNADGSYNSETGWGYDSDSVGTFIGSGGGISLYEPEPAYQQGVQSTGYRSTPDVSFVADPSTGAWIADTYNLDPSNPFEVVGGTSLSAPAWAGLLALVDQGRAAGSDPALNSTSPTEVQQALYSLPQSDYNAITSGSNGYAADAGYNLVTGLGTPTANLLVPDLIGYQGAGTTYSGATVAPLQNSGLVSTGSTDSGPMDVFSVFDSFVVTQAGLKQGRAPAVIGSAVERGPARKLPVPANTTSSAVDRAVTVMVDETSPDTLIGDLAFEQVSSGNRKARGSAAIGATN